MLFRSFADGADVYKRQAYGAGATVNLVTGTATGTKGVSDIGNIVFMENGNKDTVTDAGGVLNFSALNAALTMTVNTDGSVATTDGSNTIIAGTGTSKIIGGSGNNTVKFDNKASFGGTKMCIRDRPATARVLL